MSETTTSPTGIRRPGWPELIVAVLAYLVLSIGVGFALSGTQLDVIPLLLVNEGIILLAVVVALAIRIRRPSAVGLGSIGWKWLLVGLGAGVLACLANRIVVIVYILLTGDASNPQADFTGAAAPGGWSLLGILLAGALLAAFAEELFFRGIVYGALRRYGVLLATVVSALLFGLAHGVNVVLPAAVLLGVVNAVLYERSGSIWPPIVAHAVNNAILFTLASILL
jgi:uncharacterized protein